MKHYLDLIPISARLHRRQSRMTRICIVLAVFLVSVMFGLADMYLQGMTEETRRQTGDWHCRFAVPDADAADLIAFGKLVPLVKEAVIRRDQEAMCIRIQ